MIFVCKDGYPSVVKGTNRYETITSLKSMALYAERGTKQKSHVALTQLPVRTAEVALQPLAIFMTNLV
jgi:hypothetical protein